MFTKKIIVGIVLIISLLVLTTKVIADPLEIVKPKYLSIEQQVVYFSALYGVNPNLMLSVMNCESEGNQNAKGDGGRSFGIFQFQKETWSRISKDMGEVLDINSTHDQAKLASWAFANDYEREWTSYRAIKNGGSYSFYSKQLKKNFHIHCELSTP